MSRDDQFREFALAQTPRLLRGAWLLCGEHQLAEDLTQETLAKVYLAWGKRGIDNAGAYAHTTMVRTFISARRKRSSSEQPAAIIADRSASDGDSDLRLDLMTALAALSPVDRAVLVLRFLEDQPVSRAAEALGLSELAVRSRTQRALQQVRLHLGSRSDYLEGGL